MFRKVFISLSSVTAVTVISHTEETFDLSFSKFADLSKDLNSFTCFVLTQRPVYKK